MFRMKVAIHLRYMWLKRPLITRIEIDNTFTSMIGSPRTLGSLSQITNNSSATFAFITKYRLVNGKRYAVFMMKLWSTYLQSCGRQVTDTCKWTVCTWYRISLNIDGYSEIPDNTIAIDISATENTNHESHGLLSNWIFYSVFLNTYYWFW